MGSKKDIHDMLSGLLNSVKDKEIASKIADIQSAVLMLQAVELKTKEENLDLHNEISSLKEQLLRSIQIMTRLKTEKDRLHSEKPKFSYQIEKIQKELFQLVTKPGAKPVKTK
jgi:uncharacterized coiled-coil DUF342 family protein